eukprot:6227568-Amphidinium_carterae.1
MRANDGSYHDSSSSSGHFHLTDDKDFNEHPELAFMLTSEDKRMVEAVVKMRFNRNFHQWTEEWLHLYLKHNLMAIKMKMGMMT